MLRFQAALPRVAALFLSFAVGLALTGRPAAGQAGGAPTQEVFTGRVLLPGGAPGGGAVVVTSAGGHAVTDATGGFELAVDLPANAESVQVTAVSAHGSLVASARVAPLVRHGTTDAGRIMLAASASCEPSWLPTFGEKAGVNKPTQAVTVYDDGSGPVLVAGGRFTTAGGVNAGGIAAWNGQEWKALGSGFRALSLSFGPLALAVFDDGSGPALYAGGDFDIADGAPVNNIARWDGTGWSAVGSGVDSIVHALLVYDDGSGPALYAGGDFTSAGGVPAKSIARWDGTSWSEPGGGVATGFPTSVRSLGTFDDGSGLALYAGGSFGTAGAVVANSIARWNGTSWSALGSGITGSIAFSSADVYALAVFDDGSGPALHAGGVFTHAGGVPASCIAKWDGTGWSAVGGGVSKSSGVPYVDELAVFDDGSGPALFVGGDFKFAGILTSRGLAKWSGTTWSSPGSLIALGIDPVVRALTVYDDGGGPALFVGGSFTTVDGIGMNNIAKLDGAGWSSLGGSIDAAALALTTFDDGSGPALFAGGYFDNADGVTLNGVARWDGQSWSPLGAGVSGFGGFVTVMAVFDDGGGPALYAGGQFLDAGGVIANHIAKWNGTSWSALAGGVGGGGPYGASVDALTVFDDGSGPALYVGGVYSNAGGVPANNIARWDGTSWSALGTGVGFGSWVGSLAVFDDGGGPALYAGGNFTTAGGAPGNHIAKWNGTSWSALGSGVGGGCCPRVSALTVFDDGSGAALYASGLFTDAGGVAANMIARWNGASWSALGSGVSGYSTDVLTVHDDGSGPALYLGGLFETAGGVAANSIARWDGTSWSALGIGMAGGSVEALAVHDDGGGPALFAGGIIPVSPGGDSYIAKWGCQAITALPGCAGNPASLSALVFGAPLGSPLPLRITGSAAASGLGLVSFGASGLDAGGCGLLVPGIGELLLAPAPPPVLLASGPLSGGICDVAPPVPSTPALRGVTAHLQGAAIDPALPSPIEPTNALAVTLGP